jgi:hypothetical protein
MSVDAGAVPAAAALDAPPPSLHLESGTVRFWVDMGGGKHVGASISKQALHYRFNAQASGDDAVDVYRAHGAEIDAAVRRRLAAGSREPILLREGDLGPRSTP